MNHIPFGGLNHKGSSKPNTPMKRFKPNYRGSLKSSMKRETEKPKKMISSSTGKNLSISDDSPFQVKSGYSKNSKYLKQTKKVRLNLSSQKSMKSNYSSTLATVEILPKKIQINISNKDVCKSKTQVQSERREPSIKPTVSHKFKNKIDRLANEYEESIKSKRSTQCSEEAYKAKGYSGLSKEKFSKYDNFSKASDYARKSLPSSIQGSLACSRANSKGEDIRRSKNLYYTQKYPNKAQQKKGIHFKSLKSMRPCTFAAETFRMQHTNANSLQQYITSGRLNKKF
mmetsp:Transcript_28182/g.27974  ORF Transcript_28182/g.27974 Transcript_28182/m.27974 type:complete len:285 (-) Transcript_28182:21-875(-)